MKLKLLRTTDQSNPAGLDTVYLNHHHQSHISLHTHTQQPQHLAELFMPRINIIVISPFLLFSILLLPSFSSSFTSRRSSSRSSNILPAFSPPSSSSSSSPFNKPSATTVNNNSFRDIHTQTHAQGEGGGRGGGGKTSSVFEEFAQFIEKTQKEIIQTIEVCVRKCVCVCVCVHIRGKYGMCVYTFVSKLHRRHNTI